MNVTVLDYLFNKLPKIKALDFCGASSELFARAFNELQITREDLSITKLSFHDCSNLAPEVFEKYSTFSQFEKIRFEPYVDYIASIIKTSIRYSINTLVACPMLKIDNQGFDPIFGRSSSSKSGIVTMAQLQIDSNVVSPLSDIYLLYTLKHLKAPKLKYLNIGGMPVNYKILLTIKAKFAELESLNISHAPQS